MFSKICLLAFLAAVAVASAVPKRVVRANSNIYVFSTTQVSFVQAWTYCKNANEKFVSIPTAAQNAALSRALADLGASSLEVWIGAIYMRNGFVTKWYWVDGQEDLNYSNWDNGTTVAPASGDYCAYLNYNSTTHEGIWKTAACSDHKYFVCSI